MKIYTKQYFIDIDRNECFFEDIDIMPFKKGFWLEFPKMYFSGLDESGKEDLKGTIQYEYVKKDKWILDQNEVDKAKEIIKNLINKHNALSGIEKIISDIP